MSTCTLLEQALGRELVWIACHHHVFELVLSGVFKVTIMGRTSGPEIGLFKRFQKLWPSINKSRVNIPSDDVFVHMPFGLREEMKLYFAEAIQTKATRDDYLELLQLSYIFLGESFDNEATFRSHGAMHNTRWMAKAIYSLKIYLFQDQVRLTAKEITGLTSICLFVSLLYGVRPLLA